MQEWDKKHGTMHHYNYLDKVYDAQYLEEQNAKIGNVLKTVELRSNELVLDIGCGTGFLFHYINKRVGLLVGMDISKKLLREAKKHTKNLPNVLLVNADADNTPFQNHLFYKIFAITLLQNMPDPTTTILEMKRISRPEAVFVLTGLKKKFTRESFVDLLKQAQLKVSAMKTNERLKDYVAVCTKVKPTV